MSDNLRGIGLMTLAMFGLALSDMFVKFSAQMMPPAQIILFVAGGTTLLYAGGALALGQPLFSRDFFRPMILFRTLFEALASVAMMTALAYVPLSTVTAIMQSNPLLVTMGAALFLSETVGWRRWLAIAIGLVAMLMIVRPGAQEFDPAVLAAVAAAVCLSARDLSTRAAPARIPSLVLAAWGFSGATLAGLVLVLVAPEAPPVPQGAWLSIGGAVAVTALGYYALTASVRVGQISTVAPFRYTRLVFALAIAVAVFDERPDGWTIAGSLIIVASGIYTFLRERSAARAMASPAGTGPV